jgi:hypothetical protein
MKRDYTQFEKTAAEPEASSMIETFRAIGYNIETAIADIIDNSISAGAKNIWVNFEWKGEDTFITISDDGEGMNNDELIRALRPGSKNPLEDRNPKDLGRFGLGLKTASFSQCRELTVISKKLGDSPVFWSWDLDFVNQTGKWELIKYQPDPVNIDSIQSLESGTTVIWRSLDRLVKNMNSDNQEALSKFLETMDNVKRHLSMVFHRFLEQNKFKIYFNDRIVEAWNPFLLGEKALQVFPDENLSNGKVLVKGFILPHKSKISEEIYKKAEGPRGWNAQQGFYIYRNERLLLAGDWLGFFRKEEHYKLARIQIDLPNTLDKEWQIDIKKSVARPPYGLGTQLRQIASKIRAQAVEVYRHKGRILQRKFSNNDFYTVWNEKIRHGKRFYEINREHPLVKNILSKNESTKTDIASLLKFIEETVPVSLITIRESEQPELQGQAFEGIDHEPIRNSIKKLYLALIEKGKQPDEAKSFIMSIEPFNFYPQYIDSID